MSTALGLTFAIAGWGILLAVALGAGALGLFLISVAGPAAAHFNSDEVQR